MYCREEGDCLLWALSCNSAGKPQARLDGRTQMVQRYVYETLCRRQLADGRRLTTRCGNAICVAPDCLISSTYSAILRRSYERGARSTAAKYAMRVNNLVVSGRTKINREIACEIRNSNESASVWADRLGMNEASIRRIKNGQNWRAKASSVFSWRP